MYQNIALLFSPVSSQRPLSVFQIYSPTFEGRMSIDYMFEHDWDRYCNINDQIPLHLSSRAQTLGVWLYIPSCSALVELIANFFLQTVPNNIFAYYYESHVTCFFLLRYRSYSSRHHVAHPSYWLFMPRNRRHFLTNKSK